MDVREPVVLAYPKGEKIKKDFFFPYSAQGKGLKRLLYLSRSDSTKSSSNKDPKDPAGRVDTRKKNIWADADLWIFRFWKKNTLRAPFRKCTMFGGVSRTRGARIRECLVLFLPTH